MTLIDFREAARRLRPEAPIAAPRLADLLPRYQAYLVGEKRRDQGRERYLWGLGRVVAWLGDSATMADLTPDAVRRYKEQLGAEGRAGSTVINALAVIKDFCRWAIEAGLRADDPTAGIRRPPKAEPDPNPLYPEELDLLLDAIREPAGLDADTAWVWRRNVRAVLLMTFAGLRLSETAALCWPRVKLRSGVVEVRGGKGGKDRLITAPAPLIAVLEAVPAAERRHDRAVAGRELADAARGLPRGAPLTAKGIEKIFTRWLRPTLEAAGAPFARELHPHRLRHTYASMLVWEGADLRTVQQLLGHAQIGTTERYVAVLLEQKRQATSRLDRYAVSIKAAEGGGEG